MNEVDNAQKKFLELFDQANLDPTDGESGEASFVQQLRKNNEDLFNGKKKEIQIKLDSYSSVRKREKKQFQKNV